MAYVTLAALREYLSIPASRTQDDDLLTAFIERAQAWFEGPDGAGRVFECSQDTIRRFDCPLAGERDLLFGRYDLAALTSITNGNGTTIAPTSYLLLPYDALPAYGVRLRSGTTWQPGDDATAAISVTGRWAYAITPPADVVQAVTRLAAWWYNQRASGQQAPEVTYTADGQVIYPAGIPRDVMGVAMRYRGTL